ncbi:hypothetical protein QBC41DRAFT_319679 [Cercophora samala]|uniref:2EXR domain-containing protein n=1 Tax=Cercophora samala TaxID=330535 RepID=A0AA40DAQ6_9PEZI|nr:hypothetical protein QBC41DRAFT_319679 [Cercophora samala]
MATTFHPFPRLPLELRAHIWQLTIQPQTIKITIPKPSTPVPPVLQACVESRSELVRAGYTKTCIEPIIGPTLNLDPPAGEDYHPQYVWANWEIDTLDIGLVNFDGENYGFARYAAVAPLVRHLRFSIPEALWSFERRQGDKGDLGVFEKVREITVFCRPAGGLASEYYDRFWPCGPENVVVVEEHHGGERAERGLLELRARDRLALSNQRYRADGPETRWRPRNVRRRGGAEGAV